MEEHSIVGRVSYNKDIIFEIIKIENNNALLKGVFVRLIADAPLSDLVLISDKEINKRFEFEQENYNMFIENAQNKLRHITGKILHVDSDNEYLKKCLRVYKDLNLYAYGVCLDEEDFAKEIMGLVEFTRPDIIVLTGHDAYNKKGLYDLKNYLNSNFFCQTILEIRKVYTKDEMFIFAGACQSNFEALIASGANFASSPNRENIDAYDPAIVAVKASTTHITNFIDIEHVFSHTNTNHNSISGIESYGKMRLLL